MSGNKRIREIRVVTATGDITTLLRKLLKNKKALSNVISTLILIGAAVVLAAAAYAFGAGFAPHEKTPIAQISFVDYPTALSSGNAFIIKHLGGDSIPLNKARLIIFNATTNQVVYSSVITDDPKNFTLNNTGIYGPVGQALDPNEDIVVHSTAINNQPGTYRIQLVYEPTKQVIAEDTITIQ